MKRNRKKADSVPEALVFLQIKSYDTGNEITTKYSGKLSWKINH